MGLEFKDEYFHQDVSLIFSLLNQLLIFFCRTECTVGELFENEISFSVIFNSLFAFTFTPNLL